jgi:hypothetical protein
MSRRYRRGLLPSTAPKNPVPPRASGNAEVASTTSTPPPIPRSLLLCAPLGALFLNVPMAPTVSL